MEGIIAAAILGALCSLGWMIGVTLAGGFPWGWSVVSRDGDSFVVYSSVMRRRYAVYRRGRFTYYAHNGSRCTSARLEAVLDNEVDRKADKALQMLAKIESTDAAGAISLAEVER